MEDKNHLNDKFKCPEDYEECVALELISSGAGIAFDKTAGSHAVLSRGVYMGQVYCSNPKKCIQDYFNKIRNTKR